MLLIRLLIGCLVIGIAVTQDCPSNKVITAASGNISTPSYPTGYPANLSCSWTIQAPVGYHIKLHFKGMHIEDCGYGCTCDKMTLAIGKTSSQRRSIICQEILNSPKDYSKPLYSIFNTIWLTFKSNNSPSNQFKGFMATFEQISYTPPDCPSDAIVHSENTGSITSPNYPNKYPTERTCYWMITVSDGPRVMLNFTNFELQDTGCRSALEGKCTCDFVKVYDGEDNTTLAELCGSKLPNPVISKSKKMLVMFSSNNLEDYAGFHAVYMSTKEERSTSSPSGAESSTKVTTDYNGVATISPSDISSSLSAGLITLVLTLMTLLASLHL